DARAYQLLAGALLALTPTLITRLGRYQRLLRATGIGALTLLIFLASAWTHLDAIQRGTAVTVTTVAILIALEAAHAGLAQRAPPNRLLPPNPPPSRENLPSAPPRGHGPFPPVPPPPSPPPPPPPTPTPPPAPPPPPPLPPHPPNPPTPKPPRLDQHRLAVIAT